jgi:Rrf2 family protein
MISKTGIHAIKALALLADLPAGAHAGAGAVAQAIGAPQNYLGKMLQALAHAGLVSSQKGLGGGFCLARPAREIRLLDVLEPIEHITRKSGCLMGRAQCSDEAPCALHARWARVREEYLKLLTETTIAEVAAAHEIPLALGA